MLHHVTTRERVALGFTFSQAISKNGEKCSLVMHNVGRDPCTEMSGNITFTFSDTCLRFIPLHCIHVHRIHSSPPLNMLFWIIVLWFRCFFRWGWSKFIVSDWCSAMQRGSDLSVFEVEMPSQNPSITVSQAQHLDELPKHRCHLLFGWFEQQNAWGCSEPLIWCPVCQKRNRVMNMWFVSH